MNSLYGVDTEEACSHHFKHEDPITPKFGKSLRINVYSDGKIHYCKVTISYTGYPISV